MGPISQLDATISGVTIGSVGGGDGGGVVLGDEPGAGAGTGEPGAAGF
jgi:hypothetical protein